MDTGKHSQTKIHEPTTDLKIKTFINTVEMTCLLLGEFIFHENNQVPFCQLRCIKAPQITGNTRGKRNLQCLRTRKKIHPSFHLSHSNHKACLGHDG